MEISKAVKQRKLCFTAFLKNQTLVKNTICSATRNILVPAFFKEEIPLL